jgi:hypothetical protein
MTLMPALRSLLAITCSQGNGEVKRIIIESAFTPIIGRTIKQRISYSHKNVEFSVVLAMVYTEPHRFSS